MSTEDNSGPAFPSLNPTMTGIDSDGFERWDTEPYGGMTLRQYAAIKLKVPDSGLDWLDEMINKSRRADFAAKAMQAMISTSNGPCLNGLDGYQDVTARSAYTIAKAMLEASKS